MVSSLYNKDILRLAASIPFLGRLERPLATAVKRSPICGSEVTVDAIVDEAGRVTALGLEVRACALGQASASLMAKHAIGRTSAEFSAARDSLKAFLSGMNDQPGTWPGLHLFGHARPYAARHAAILLAFEAVAEAASSAAELAQSGQASSCRRCGSRE
jgi:NifU-like protein involved in Fe-S cluster formation